MQFLAGMLTMVVADLLYGHLPPKWRRVANHVGVGLLMALVMWAVVDGAITDYQREKRMEQGGLPGVAERAEEEWTNRNLREAQEDARRCGRILADLAATGTESDGSDLFLKWKFRAAEAKRRVEEFSEARERRHAAY